VIVWDGGVEDCKLRISNCKLKSGSDRVSNLHFAIFNLQSPILRLPRPSRLFYVDMAQFFVFLTRLLRSTHTCAVLGRCLAPSPGTPGEGWGEGDLERSAFWSSKTPSPLPSPGVPGEGVAFPIHFSFAPFPRGLVPQFTRRGGRLFPLWHVLTVLVICSFLPASAPASSNETAANTPLIADPPAPSIPRITDTYDKEPIQRTDTPVRSANPSVTTDGDAVSLGLPRLLAAMALVVALIFLLRWVGRKFLGATPIAGGTRAVQVLSRTLVAPRQSIMLMRVGRRLLVVADNGSQLASLSEITDPDEVASLAGQLQSEKLDIAGKTFGALFGRMRKEEAGESGAVETSGSVDEPLSADEAAGAEVTDVASARAELGGLMEQVRLASNRFSRT
jgi:flagellar biogenesis protein FliO